MKRRLIAVLSFVLLVTGSLISIPGSDVVSASSPSAGCAAISGKHFGPTLTYIFPASPLVFNKGETVTVTAKGHFYFQLDPGPNQISLANEVTSASYTIPSTGAYNFFVNQEVGGPMTWTVTCGGHSSLNFTDGRCNQEPWQAFAVYPDGKGVYVFYAIYQGIGYYAMHVTEKNLDDNPDTGINHIITQSLGIQLWRLSGGALQAHRVGLDGKDYSFDLTCGAMEDGD
jgi:hypothetical protein